MRTPRMLVPACAALLAAGAARASDTLAVMDFTAANASTSEAVAISGFVRNAAVRSGNFTVVDKKNMDRILQEQAFQQTGCTSQECAVKLGKLLNVRKMIVGEYTVLGGVRFLTASLVDVESSQIERSGKVKGFEVGNADEAADNLVAQLEGQSGVTDMSGGGQVQQQQQEQTSVMKRSYTPSAPVAGPKGHTYIAFSVGPVGASTISGLTRTSDYTWSSGTFSGDKLYTFTYSDIVMQSAGPAFSMRIGGFAGPVGGELQISHVAVTNVENQNIDVTTTGEYYVPYYGYVAYNDYSFSAPALLLSVNSWTFAGNLILAIPNSKFSPYIGIGGGFAAMNVTSNVYVDENNRKLDTTVMGFVLEIPLGIRIWPTDTFFLWAEFEPTWQIILIPYKTDPPQLTSSDTFNLKVGPVTFGVGFAF